MVQCPVGLICTYLCFCSKVRLCNSFLELLERQQITAEKETLKNLENKRRKKGREKRKMCPSLISVDSHDHSLLNCGHKS